MLLPNNKITIDDLETIKNKETAIQRYELFFESTTPEIKLSLKFNDELGTRLINERNEQPESVVEDDWMEAGEMIPKQKQNIR